MLTQRTRPHALQEWAFFYPDFSSPKNCSCNNIGPGGAGGGQESGQDGLLFIRHRYYDTTDRVLLHVYKLISNTLPTTAIQATPGRRRGGLLPTSPKCCPKPSLVNEAPTRSLPIFGLAARSISNSTLFSCTVRAGRAPVLGMVARQFSGWSPNGAANACVGSSCLLTSSRDTADYCNRLRAIPRSVPGGARKKAGARTGRRWAPGMPSSQANN